MIGRGIALTVVVAAVQLQGAPAASMGTGRERCATNKCTECADLPIRPSAKTPTFGSFKALKSWADISASVKCKDDDCEQGDTYVCEETVKFGPYTGTCMRNGHATTFTSLFSSSSDVCSECQCSWSWDDKETAPDGPSWTSSDSPRVDVLVNDCATKCTLKFVDDEAKQEECREGCVDAEESTRNELEGEQRRAGWDFYGATLPNERPQSFGTRVRHEDGTKHEILYEDCLEKCDDWGFARRGRTLQCINGCKDAANAKSCAEIAEEPQGAMRRVGCEFYGTMMSEKVV